MELWDKIINKLSALWSQVDSYWKEFLTKPSNAYLVVIAIFLFLLYGVVRDWDWVVSTKPGRFTLFNVMSRKARRIFMGLVIVIAIISCAALFYFSL